MQSITGWSSGADSSNKLDRPETPQRAKKPSMNRQYRRRRPEYRRAVSARMLASRSPKVSAA